MRVMILTPTMLPAVTGNAITAERWRRSLLQQNCKVMVIASDTLNGTQLKNAVDTFTPDIIHAHHAVKSGRQVLHLYQKHNCRIPYVVSPAGTDVFLDYDDPAKRAVATDVFERASAVIVQNEHLLQRVIAELPWLEPRLTSIPKSFMWLGSLPFDLRQHLRLSSDHVVFFMPANIRPVKGNLECLHLLTEIHQKRPRIRAVFAGTVLDASYGERFCAEVERQKGFAFLIPSVAPEKIYAAYKSADVVVNSSFSEGFSNVLLEATAAGKPVLASDIPGNRLTVAGQGDVVPSAVLFNHADRADFLEKAAALVDSKGLRERLSRAAEKTAALFPTPEEEGQRLRTVYRKTLSSS